MKLSILRWSIFGYFLLLGLMPTVASASDCPPDDPSRSDCKGAASTARSPLVPIVGAAAGAGAGWVLTQIMGQGAAGSDAEAVAEAEAGAAEEGEEEKEEAEEEAREQSAPVSGNQEGRPKANPCAADEAALTDALRRQGEARWTLSNAASRLTALESLYNRAWRAGFGGSLLDVGFFGLSAWAPELGSGFFKSRVRNELMQKLGKEFAGAAVKELGKNALNRGLDVSGTGGEQALSMSKQLLDSLLQTGSAEALAELNKRWGLMGVLETSGVPAIKRLAGSSMAKEAMDSAIGAFGNAFGTLFGAGWALDDMRSNVKESSKQLQAIVKQITEAMREKHDSEVSLQDAIEDEAMARRVLARCRQIWSL